MTDKELMQMALDALSKDEAGARLSVREAIAALRARLAEPEGEQKPAGYFVLTPEISVPPGGQPFPPIWIQVAVGREDEGTPLYRQPPTAAAIRAELVAKVEAILDGIEQTECDSPNGWWETSVGAAFGSERLAAIRNLDKTRDIKEQP